MADDLNNTDEHPSEEFPDRPDTQAFRTISKHFRMQDSGDPEEYLSKDEMLALIYISRNRSKIAAIEIGESGENVTAKGLIAAFYIDAFVAGMSYAQGILNGTRDDR